MTGSLVVKLLTTALALAVVFATPDQARGQDAPTAVAELMDTRGARIGTVQLTQSPFYGVILKIEARGLEPGVLGIHIHETGRCETPGFESAGGHFNPAGRDHGILHQHGMHAGDLLNLHVPASGHVVTERMAPLVTLLPGAPNSLLDGDGTAIVIHAGADDYLSQPTGDAGGRVACGVIRQR
jgi:superoxide dismutase, Cu-Zn family